MKNRLKVIGKIDIIVRGYRSEMIVKIHDRSALGERSDFDEFPGKKCLKWRSVLGMHGCILNVFPRKFTRYGVCFLRSDLLQRFERGYSLFRA